MSYLKNAFIIIGFLYVLQAITRAGIDPSSLHPYEAWLALFFIIVIGIIGVRREFKRIDKIKGEYSDK
ncbi:hypothetical protein DDZ13_09725 [Coraliomargarita sinensis]|uniref:Uncharacterized protein n=1 Tax=Coraliomargarita sinensis TaxID=2174842 RepID=A0A317ZJF9_9BACT|nr:hypothetical protein DDZ13_09725 [Coraliomargarita sinensis]